MTETDRQLVEARMKNAEYKEIIEAQGRALLVIQKGIERKVDDVKIHNSKHPNKREVPLYMLDWLKYIVRAQTRAACVLGDQKERKHGNDPNQEKLST